jgi:hypothetical protein
MSILEKKPPIPPLDIKYITILIEVTSKITLCVIVYGTPYINMIIFKGGN